MPKDPPDLDRTLWWDPIASRVSMMWALIALLLVVRVVWQLVSPYTLIEDEAHYWEWSRHLAWSYYSKGPGVAWVIWASTQVLGDTEFAVRLPAAIATALGTIAVARTTWLMFEDQRLAFISAVLYNGIPGFAVASMLMTIDAPYIACWAWASHFAIVAMLKDKHRPWIGFGAFIAIGFLFKYTILLLIPSVMLALLVSRTHRSRRQRRWFALGLLVSMLGLVPVAIWNAQHDWATVRHLLGHLGMRGGDTQNTASSHEPWTIVWVFEYIGLQVLVGGPILALGFFAYLNAKKRASESILNAIKVAIAMSIPLLVFYLLVALKTQTEGNWAMAAFVTLIPPSAWCIRDGVLRVDHVIRFLWGAALFVLVGVLILFPGAKTLAKIPALGELIPMYRMVGMREHAQDAQRIVDELRERTGQDPFVITNHYGRASILAFYLPGHPIVYCNSAHIGGRRTQYDIWDETNITHPETRASLIGRPALMLGGPAHHWDAGFDSIEPIDPLINEPKEQGTAYIGFGYNGFEDWVPRTPKHP
jgi:4-amino-4-deoxy-L-arabinose transferase-like glycosyltransferase